MVEKIRIDTVRILRRGRLPLKPNQEIDLFGFADRASHSLFSVDYEPEKGFPAAYVKVNKDRIFFTVFKTGTVMIMGNAPLSKQEAALKLLWSYFLRNCLVEKP